MAIPRSSHERDPVAIGANDRRLVQRSNVSDRCRGDKWRNRKPRPHAPCDDSSGMPGRTDGSHACELHSRPLADRLADGGITRTAAIAAEAIEVSAGQLPDQGSRGGLVCPAGCGVTPVISLARPQIGQAVAARHGNTSAQAAFSRAARTNRRIEAISLSKPTECRCAVPWRNMGAEFWSGEAIAYAAQRHWFGHCC